MRLVLELTRRGEGRTNPNPLAGAAIKDGWIIGFVMLKLALTLDRCYPTHLDLSTNFL